MDPLKLEASFQQLHDALDQLEARCRDAAWPGAFVAAERLDGLLAEYLALSGQVDVTPGEWSESACRSCLRRLRTDVMARHLEQAMSAVGDLRDELAAHHEACQLVPPVPSPGREKYREALARMEE